MDKDEGWVCVEVLGELALQVPKGSDYALKDSEATLELRLPTEPATMVLLSCYPLPSPCVDVETELESAVETFLERCALPAFAEGSAHNLRSWCDEDWADEARAVCQGVLSTEDMRHLIVRAVHYHGRDEFYLIHWNGPEDLVADPVMRVIDSLQVSTA